MTTTTDKSALVTTRAGDYDGCDTPSNVVHSDDVPVNPIAAAAWNDRVRRGELVVIYAEPRKTSVDGGERNDEAKRA